jgi:F-type H+-transporting ATPase subunit a
MEIHVSVKPETLFEIGPLDVTNSFLTMLLVMAGILIVGSLIARRVAMVPGTAQSIFEMAIEFILNLVEGTAGKRVGRRIFPLIGALFFFIILANYSGLLPGVGTIGKWEEHAEEADSEEHAAAARQIAAGPSIAYNLQEEAEEDHEKVLVPFLRAPSADLNMTLAMALVTFTTVQIAGISAHGFVGRIKHMADPPFLFPIEVVSELSRIVSLSFRLFGNIFAGEVLVTVMTTMARTVMEKTFWAPTFFLFGLPTIFLFLEVLFGFVQSLVFALLTLIYISLAAAHGDSGEEHAHGDAHEAGHGTEHAPVPSAAGAAH